MEQRWKEKKQRASSFAFLLLLVCLLLLFSLSPAVSLLPFAFVLLLLLQRGLRAGEVRVREPLGGVGLRAAGLRHQLPLRLLW